MKMIIVDKGEGEEASVACLLPLILIIIITKVVNSINMKLKSLVMRE
jgi:hypothetical protein